MTFFGKNRYPAVPEDGRLMTAPFLEASRHVTTFFDLALGRVFVFVKNDVDGNIKKINKKFIENEEKYKTISDILEDKNLKGDKVLKDAHIGTIWLYRGLHFLQKLLENIVEDYESGVHSQNSSGVLKKAYIDTLKTHHNFIVQKGLQATFLAAPYMKDLLEPLKQEEGATIDMVIADMKQYTVILDENNIALKALIVKLDVKE